MQAAATCQPWQFSRCHLFPSPLLSSTYHWLRFPTRPPLPLRVCLWLSLSLQKDSIFQCCLTQLLWFHFWVSLSPSPSFFITLISFLSKSLSLSLSSCTCGFFWMFLPFLYCFLNTGAATWETACTYIFQLSQFPFWKSWADVFLVSAVFFSKKLLSWSQI